MFHAKRCPAEAPYAAHIDELYEWDFHQKKHQVAVHNAQQLVDSKLNLASAGYNVRPIQEHTRRFAQDQKKAEIGRENRKLVERLQKISKGVMVLDPRAPPPRGTGSSGAQRAVFYPERVGPTPLGEQRARSLNEPLRRKTQRGVDQDNASLVRRILSTKSTFSRDKEAADFAHHRRDERMLRRLPDTLIYGQSARQLPPLGVRKSSERIARELEGNLFMVGDLMRSAPTLALSAPAPLLALEASPSEGSRGQKFEARQTAPGKTPDSPTRRQVVSQEQLSRHSPPQEEAMGERDSLPRTWGAQNVDEETERRHWVQDEQGSGESPIEQTSHSQSLRLQGTQASMDSVIYSDGWDEASLEESDLSRTGAGLGATRSSNFAGRSRSSASQDSEEGPGDFGRTESS
jgi:hypothetical protein